MSEREIAKSELIRWDSKRTENHKKLSDLEEVRIIFQKASQLTQRQLSKTVSDIVSNALAAVFEDPYTFKIEFVSRRNVTECDLLFERNEETRSPLDSCGYGAADIASLALRVAYWKLGNSRNVLILDEPTRNLDAKKQRLASIMIKKLSRMSGGLQFIIVTHNKDLAESADRQFRVIKENEVSHVTMVNESQSKNYLVSPNELISEKLLLKEIMKRNK